MKNGLDREIKGQFARLRAAGNRHGHECLVTIASEALARRGGGNAHQRAKARQWAIRMVRELAVAA